MDDRQGFGRESESIATVGNIWKSQGTEWYMVFLQRREIDSESLGVMTLDQTHKVIIIIINIF